MVCINCGEENRDGVKFCMSCHTKFENAKKEDIKEIMETAQEAVKSGDKNKMQDVYQKILFDWMGDKFGEAAPVLEIIAKAGNVNAQVMLGTRYSKGIGVELNYEKAADLLFKAAEQGNKDAMQRLGDLYDSGNIKQTNPLYLLFPKLKSKNNEKKAAQWKEKGEKKIVQVACDHGSCMYSYTIEKGDPNHNIPPGTNFEDLPEDWVCPLCGNREFIFSMG